MTADKAVIAALDARLPQWEGPKAVLHPPSIEGISGSGWWGEGSSDPSPISARMRVVMDTMERYKHDNIRLAQVFDPIPPVTDISYLSFDGPVTFSLINTNIKANRYYSLKDVDIDMSRLFEKARRFYAEGSQDYGRVLILQRLYNALTAPYPLMVSGIPEQSQTLFASLPAGPGNARSLHETTQELRAGAAEQDVGFGITTFRVGTKDRVFTQEARHKGMVFRLGKLRRVGANDRRFHPPYQPRRCNKANCWPDFQDVCPYQGVPNAPRYSMLVLSTRADRTYRRPNIF